MRQVMMSNVAPNNEHAPIIEADLEEALELAGTGRYQVVHNLVMLATLFASILEMIGIAFILPAAACDLDIPDYLKGILTSLPNIGIILTAPFWGRAADSMGRKPVLLGSLIVSGATAFIAAFMPSLVTFALFKLASSLFTRKLMILGLAWIILSYDWEYQFGTLDLRPWRLLTAVYAFPLLLAALCMIGADESPKFLMTKGKDKEALAVVRKIYCVNSGLHEDSYCTNNFATCYSLNGLFLFAPDTINKVMNSNETSGTVCELMDMSDNSTSSTECLDSISYHTFYIMVVTTLVYGVLVTAGSMSPLSKKTLLVSMFCVVGVGCLIAGLSTNRILAGVAMSSLQLTALGIGPLTAYVVHLFPTTLRGTAVGAVLMFGRLGSVVGANAAGVFLSAACILTFYGFAFLVFLCAGLSFLLPSTEQTTKPQEAGADS
ncbi:hypothetical protein HF086_018315 [Spodoptera exigua]|uniref:Major facilitator superfamily (MFS) profile domain-containing protein n=1 Tax=Spodoptera exigua TaxID=7107 RepID=A0A922S8C2_SPOEX|nr:hypothetical protein HF086_018315 [Spodoptera exigua]